jgi:hypothetical protein
VNKFCFLAITQLPEMGSLGQNGNNSISNSDDDAWSENSNRVNTL